LDRSAINNELPVSRGSARPNYEIRPPSIFGFNLLANLSKLLQYKDLVWTLSLHRIKVRYKQSVLGILWAFVQPISMMLVFTFIFSLIARMPSEGIPYAIFAFTALLPWNYFSTSVANGTSSLVKDAQFVTKVYFPREILPITYIVAALFDFVVASILLLPRRRDRECSLCNTDSFSVDLFRSRYFFDALSYSGSLSRHRHGRAVAAPALVVCHACDLSAERGSGTMAVILCIESDGRNY
jgi:hypothetical protein